LAKIGKKGKNWQKLAKIGKNWQKLAKLTKPCRDFQSISINKTLVCLFVFGYKVIIGDVLKV